MSHARVCSLESRVEALAQSEGRLREQVSVLEEEKKQLAGTVTRLQDLLSSLGIHTTADGLTQPPARSARLVPGKAQARTGPRALALPEGS